MLIFTRFDAPKKRKCLKPDDLDSRGRRCGKRAGKGKAEENSKPTYKGKCLRASDLTSSGRKCGKRSLEIRKPDEFKKITEGEKTKSKPAKKSKPSFTLDTDHGKIGKDMVYTDEYSKEMYGENANTAKARDNAAIWNDVKENWGDSNRVAVRDSKGNIQAAALYKDDDVNPDGEKMLYVDYLATAPHNLKEPPDEKKMKGAGTQMLANLAKMAVDQGFGSMELTALKGAESFYEKIGMVEDPAQSGWLKHYVMSGETLVNFAKLAE